MILAKSETERFLKEEFLGFNNLVGIIYPYLLPPSKIPICSPSFKRTKAFFQYFFLPIFLPLILLASLLPTKVLTFLTFTPKNLSM